MIVHEPLAGTAAPDRTTLLPLLAAVTVPPHEDTGLAAAVLTRPAGYVSVKATPVVASVFALVSVMVSTETSPVPIAAGANALAATSRATTESVAVAPTEVPAFTVVTRAGAC